MSGTSESVNLTRSLMQANDRVLVLRSFLCSMHNLASNKLHGHSSGTLPLNPYKLAEAA